MPAKKKVFLESHNISNLHSGFGQFNYWLIKKMVEHNKHFSLTASAKRRSAFNEFGEEINFQRYYALSRYKPFRLRTEYDLWHSLNQNSKVEPFDSSIPYLMTLHDVTFMEKDPIEKISKKKVNHLKEKIEKSHAIVFISEHAKRSANHFFDIPKSIPQPIIYNGNPVIAHEDISPSTSPYNFKKPFLFSIGQFLEKKNFHTLIGMLAKLKDYQLVLAGNNNKPYAEVVRKEITKYGLKERVFLVGKIPEKDKHYLLKNCDAFVFPSLFEGFGLPPIEAMAYGKPVFLANRTSLPEIGGEYAFYWDEFNPEYMADVFQQGMNDFHNNKVILQNGLRNRAKSFSWDKTAKEYLKIYQSLT